MWAEPSNKNPLEKTTLSREGFTAQSPGMKEEGKVRGTHRGVHMPPESACTLQS